MTKTLQKEEDEPPTKLGSSKEAYQLLSNPEHCEEFQEIRTLFIISRLPKRQSSYETENQEDMGLSIQEILNQKSFDKFNQNNESFKHESKRTSEYSSISKLRMKKIRESIESPDFGSKGSSFVTQKNLSKALSVSSRDELENANIMKQPVHLFQK
mmetsp:Transcript_35291/g.34952  ORF Transcript_35291/g.34952 Transcript_35291/m.34952 type:complete len:156 (-) Transcript_35291:625-1092(-)